MGASTGRLENGEEGEVEEEEDGLPPPARVLVGAGECGTRRYVPPEDGTSLTTWLQERFAQGGCIGRKRVGSKSEWDGAKRPPRNVGMGFSTTHNPGQKQD